MSQRKVYPAKAPGETLKYQFNWSPRNIGSERILTISATVVSGTIIVESTAIEDVPNARDYQGTAHIISGGIDGELAQLLLEATTDGDNSPLQQTVYHPIRVK